MLIRQKAEMKTSKVDFEKFKTFAAKWLQALGLTEWDVVYTHNQANDDSLASCATDPEGMNATLNLDTRKDDTDIGELALHEVLELLLAKMDTMARDRTFDDKLFDSERHNVINRIMMIIKRSSLWEDKGAK